MSIDPRAVSGFAFADSYARGRPSYPVGMIDRIIDSFRLTATSAVLDLAAGTGQLSRLVHQRVGGTVAVEPSPPMRAKIVEELGDVAVLGGSAEGLPLASAGFDAVVVGEAFHWFHTAAAGAEIARVLAEHGGLALLWNSPTWTVESTPWLEPFRQLLAHHKRAAGDYPAGAWQEHLEGTGLFEPLTHVRAGHVHTLERDGFVAQVASWSWIANLPGEQRQAVLSDVEALLGDHDEIVIPYDTDLYLTRRRTSASRRFR